MFSLTIVFGPAATAWTLMFKTTESATTAFTAATEDARGVRIADDFGQNLFIVPSQISGLLLEDMALSSEARIERGLDQARSQAKAQERAMADPALMASMRRTQQGPAVLQPGGMPRMM